MAARQVGSGPRMTVPRLDDSPIPPVSPDRRRQAALVVCGRAGDRDSARTVLEALGLIDDPAIAGALEAMT
jgi:hypothetical protein